MPPVAAAVLAAIRARRAALPRSRAVLVALSRIDGSDKGYVAGDLAAQSKPGGLRAVARSQRACRRRPR